MAAKAVKSLITDKKEKYWYQQESTMGADFGL
jgi:hypothetical protein